MSDPDSPPPSRPEDLYALPPEQFVAARNELARELKRNGERETAAVVAALRRPPVSAWALNQVARSEPQLVEALFEAAGSLRAGLQRGANVKAAQGDFRAAVGAIVRAGLDVLERAGRSGGAGVQMEMQNTLQAAAVDEELRPALLAGVLVDDESAPGFVVGDGELPPRPKLVKPAKGPAKGSTRASGKASAKDAAKEAEDEAAQREAQERATRRRELMVRVNRMRNESDKLRRRADRLDEAARTAEATAVARRTEAEDARRDLVRCLDELADLELEAERAGGR